MKIWYSGGRNPVAIIEPGYDRKTDSPENLDQMINALKTHGYHVTKDRLIVLVDIKNREEYKQLKDLYMNEKRILHSHPK